MAGGLDKVFGLILKAGGDDAARLLVKNFGDDALRESVEAVISGRAGKVGNLAEIIANRVAKEGIDDVSQLLSKLLFQKGKMNGQVLEIAAKMVKEGGDEATESVVKALAKSGASTKDLAKAGKEILGGDVEALAKLASEANVGSGLSILSKPRLLGKFAREAGIENVTTKGTNGLVEFAERMGIGNADDLAAFSKGYGINTRPAWAVFKSSDKTRTFVQELTDNPDIVKNAAEGSISYGARAAKGAAGLVARNKGKTVMIGGLAYGAYKVKGLSGGGSDGDIEEVIDRGNGELIANLSDGSKTAFKGYINEDGTVVKTGESSKPLTKDEVDALDSIKKEDSGIFGNLLAGIKGAVGVGSLKNMFTGDNAPWALGILGVVGMIGGSFLSSNGLPGMFGDTLGGLFGGIISTVGSIALLGAAVIGGVKLFRHFTKNDDAPAPDVNERAKEKDGVDAPARAPEPKLEASVPENLRDAAVSAAPRGVEGGESHPDGELVAVGGGDHKEQVIKLGGRGNGKGAGKKAG